MPELPEVETIKNTLNELVLNKTITNVDVFRDQTILGNVNDFKKSLKNAKIIGFERIGKFIIFVLNNDNRLISHLRMEGKFFLKNENEQISKHDLVVFHFSDNTKLIYNDTRRFGIMCVALATNYKIVPPLSNVGPDPFMIENGLILEKSFKNKSIPIKTALLDQSIMSGLGNIYVDEVLYATKIHPETPAKCVSRKLLDNIVKESKIVLTKALEAGGTTIKSYHPREGISGNFQVTLKVYGKKDKCCSICGTKFVKIFVNGRGTTYCPKCQKNPYTKDVIGVTGPIGAGKTTVSKTIEKLGYFRIDADEIVHSLYKERDVIHKIKTIIPELKVSKNEIDRVWLKKYLISNQNKKKLLEKLVHKLVINKIKIIVKKTTQPVVIEAPFLFETGLNLICTKTIYVEANQESQINHLNNRKSDVKSSLELNKNYNYQNKKKATFVISNNGNVADLEKQINTIFCK